MAATMLAVTLIAAIYTRLQGILITSTGVGMFVVAMLLIPRMKREALWPPGAQLATAS